MKKILFALFMFNSLFIFGQPSNPAPTTEEEYNYLTKGYKVQTESGLDMKKGYTFVDLGKATRGSYDFEVKILMRELRKEVAGYLIISHSRVSGKTYFNCIPIDNSELLERYYKDISNWDSSILANYCFMLSSMLGNVTSTANELQKKVK